MRQVARLKRQDYQCLFIGNTTESDKLIRSGFYSGERESTMLFKRRHPPTMGERVRVALWPRRSWSRSVRYVVKRLRRAGGSPHMIALGIAAGAFSACLPYWGLQLATAGLLAWVLRASVGAALLSTFLANPLTIPLIWSASYVLGNAMLGGAGAFDAARLHEGLRKGGELLSQGAPGAIDALTDVLWPVFKPISLGSLPLGLMVAIFFYYTSKPVVEAYQQRRSVNMSGRRQGWQANRLGMN